MAWSTLHQMSVSNLCETSTKPMSRYHTLPEEVDAFKYGVDVRPEWFQDKVSSNDIVTADTHCFIKTLTSQITAEHGDYIILRASGEIAVLKSHQFEMLFVPAS